jgi:hypothetical protein
MAFTAQYFGHPSIASIPHSIYDTKLAGGRQYVLFAWLISHQTAVFFSQNKPATSNQPTVLFSQNEPAPAISHQPNLQAPFQCHGYSIPAN